MMDSRRAKDMTTTMRERRIRAELGSDSTEKLMQIDIVKRRDTIVE